MKLLLISLLLAAPLAAQDDFLTSSEVFQVREAQEPNARLALYAAFARQRVQTVVALLAKEKTGRSALVHDTLDAYSKIIDALDDVADEAAAHNTDVSQGLAAVASAERYMLDALEQIRDRHPSDLERYAFVLDQAILTTTDSRDAAEQDLKERGADVRARDEKERKAKDAEMAPADGSPRKPSEQQTDSTDSNEPKKPPTLMRPGEKPPPQ